MVYNLNHRHIIFIKLRKKTRSRDIVDFRYIVISTINTMKKLYLIVLLIPFFGISQKACNVFGKIKFVEYGEDYKVKFVDYGEDLKIKYVKYGESKIGKWKAVDYGEDYKLKVVKYGEDFKAKEVDYGEGCN